ncbi:hypothetical protein EVG20_g11648, partial [Dentipellis fragilis]
RHVEGFSDAHAVGLVEYSTIWTVPRGLLSANGGKAILESIGGSEDADGVRRLLGPRYDLIASTVEDDNSVPAPEGVAPALAAVLAHGLTSKRPAQAKTSGTNINGLPAIKAGHGSDRGGLELEGPPAKKRKTSERPAYSSSDVTMLWTSLNPT